MLCIKLNQKLFAFLEIKNFGIYLITNDGIKPHYKNVHTTYLYFNLIMFLSREQPYFAENLDINLLKTTTFVFDG